MNEETLNEKLKKHDLTILTACDLIYMLTSIVLSPRNIRSQLSRQGHLSGALSVAFAFLFRELSNGQV